MPLVSTADSALHIRTLTRNQLCKRILRESGLGTYGVVTSGDTNFLIDTTKLKSSQYSEDEWVDGWVRISKDSSSVGSALENSISPITDYAPTTGTISFNPSFSIATAAGDEYELWRFPNPNEVMDTIDQCLLNDIYLPCWSLISEVPDFDMEQSGTSDWSATNATIAKATSTRNRGKRSLTVTTTSANGYASTASLYVEPQKSYFASVDFTSGDASTTAKLVAFDITNNAEITSKTATRRNVGKLWFEFTSPSGCYEIKLRLQVVETTSTVTFDDVIFFSTEQKTVSLPWWVSDREQVKGVFQLDLRDVSTNLATDELIGEQDERWDVMDTAFGNYNKLKLRARYGTCTRPLYIFGVRSETAFSDDNSDYKLVSEDYLLSGVLTKLFSTLKNEPREGLLDAKFFERKYEEWSKKWEQEAYKVKQRLNDVIRSPNPTGYFNNISDDLGWS